MGCQGVNGTGDRERSQMLRCEGSVAMVADAEERAKGEVAEAVEHLPF